MRGLRRHRHPDQPGHDAGHGHPRGHGRGRHRGEHGHGPRGVRPQARRGALRAAVLSLLAEQPMHGYQVMQELETRSGGRWRPSAGSIYPTLQQLEDERLIQADEIDGRRTFALTDTGRQAAAALPTERSWTGGRERGGDLRGLTRELGVAAMQVARVGSPAAVESAATILAEARRGLYRLLADDVSSTADDGDARATAGDGPIG
jgi:DNA-binding PadR family transcriptional regulator